MTTRRQPDPRVQVIERLFHRKPVAQLNELQRALGTSTRTVFRVLDRLGYLSSYSHAGAYYTLRRIPQFDTHGLWFHGEPRFSMHGSLRASVVVLVCQAPAGHTHEELAALLRLRIHDTLRSLVEAGSLGRERVEAVYVYVDPDPRRAAAQLEQRHRMAPTPAAAAPLPPAALDLPQVVEVLVAVIHAPRDDTSTIAAHLRARGLAVTNKQVEAVFAQYALQKKTAPSRSPRSRR